MQSLPSRHSPTGKRDRSPSTRFQGKNCDANRMASRIDLQVYWEECVLRDGGGGAVQVRRVHPQQPPSRKKLAKSVLCLLPDLRR